jgi:hypothetical protein
VTSWTPEVTTQEEAHVDSGADRRAVSGQVRLRLLGFGLYGVVQPARRIATIQDMSAINSLLGPTLPESREQKIPLLQWHFVRCLFGSICPIESMAEVEAGR